MEVKASEIGLTLNISKCELIPIGIQSHNYGLFPKNIKIIQTNGFEYLGAPIGNKEFCNEFTVKKVENLQPLFKALIGLEDTHVSYFLLKSCASYSKMTYLTRVTPPNYQTNGLSRFDSEVRSCFEQISGIICDDFQWSKACLSTKNGGIGLKNKKK